VLDQPVQARGSSPGPPGNLRRQRLGEGSLPALGGGAAKAVHLQMEFHHPPMRGQGEQSPPGAVVHAAGQLTADRAVARRRRWMCGDDDAVRPGLERVDQDTRRQERKWIEEMHLWRSLANGTGL
jgi:hypothetical protein